VAAFALSSWNAFAKPPATLESEGPNMPKIAAKPTPESAMFDRNLRYFFTVFPASPQNPAKKIENQPKKKLSNSNH
jgi:hypothetical protein